MMGRTLGNPSGRLGNQRHLLEAACTRLGDWRVALGVCDRVLGKEPTSAPVFFRRARLRAHLFQFHEATADNLAGLALLARSQKR